MKFFLKNHFKNMLRFTACTLSLLVVSCSVEDVIEAVPIGIALPQELGCDFFLQDRTLEDNPDAPVDYIVTCRASVEGKLTINPGVVILFINDGGLHFQTSSSIHAVGTVDKPIVMSGTESNPGWWAGLFFRSGDSSNIMEHVSVSYAGGGEYNGHGFANVAVYSGATLNMKNCIIANSLETGLNASWRYIDINLENNIFTQNPQPLKISYANVHKISANNSFTGNILDRVLLYGDSEAIEEDVIWQKLNVPYRSLGNIGVGAQGTLTINPGVEIEMGSNTGIGSTGGLKIVGTAELPIIINGEFSGSGSWKGIYMNSTHVINEIGFVKISDAGENPTINKGAVSLWYDAKLNIHDTEFKDAASCGVYGKLHFGQGENPNYTSSNLTFINTECGVNFEE